MQDVLPEHALSKRPETPSLVLCTWDVTSFSRRGFRWPGQGAVDATDWDPQQKHAGGLHGLLWGEGNGAWLSSAEDAVWIVCAVAPETPLVHLDGHVRFQRGEVVYNGIREEALALVRKHAPPGTLVYGDSSSVGDKETASAGFGGQAQAGLQGTACAGGWGMASAGDAGRATSGDGGISVAGDQGSAFSGQRGTSATGYGGHSAAGNGGITVSGYRGYAQADIGGFARSGDGGTVIVGPGGCGVVGCAGLISGGVGATLVARWREGLHNRHRAATAIVGEDGIEPNVPYMCTGGK